MKIVMLTLQAAEQRSQLVRVRLSESDREFYRFVRKVGSHSQRSSEAHQPSDRQAQATVGEVFNLHA